MLQGHCNENGIRFYSNLNNGSTDVKLACPVFPGFMNVERVDLSNLTVSA